MFGREEIEALIKHHELMVEKDKRYLLLAFVGLTKDGSDNKKKKVEYMIHDLRFRMEMRESRIKALKKELENGDC